MKDEEWYWNEKFNNDYRIGEINQSIEMDNVYHAKQYIVMKAFNLKPFKDGNMWCVLFGENVQEGVAGFGESPFEAIVDFNENWNKPIKQLKE